MKTKLLDPRAKEDRVNPALTGKRATAMDKRGGENRARGKKRGHPLKGRVKSTSELPVPPANSEPFQKKAEIEFIEPQEG